MAHSNHTQNQILCVAGLGPSSTFDVAFVWLVYSSHRMAHLVRFVNQPTHPRANASSQVRRWQCRPSSVQAREVHFCRCGTSNTEMQKAAGLCCEAACKSDPVGNRFDSAPTNTRKCIGFIAGLCLSSYGAKCPTHASAQSERYAPYWVGMRTKRRSATGCTSILFPSIFLLIRNEPRNAKLL